MHAIGKCVTGMERKRNEDAIYVSDGSDCLESLYIVADGIGGHAGGDAASNGAIEAFLEYVEHHCAATGTELLDVLIGALQYANSCVYSRSRLDKELAGMGTTFLAASIKEDTLYGVHIGDSRLYLFRNGKLVQLSKDHSYVMEMMRQGKLTAEEARIHPKRNIITKALGLQEAAEPDTIIEKLQPGDCLLLCTDGLTTMLEDREIEAVLSQNKETSALVDQLVDMANANGGYDNISVILVRDRR